jgi:MoaA/NifB/PqqE/SkfB family radical SAM enzyme
MPSLYSIQPAPKVSAEAARIRVLPILILNVHNRCNCRCVMCDIWKRTEDAQLDAADLERHRDSIRSLGVRHVVLTGGEPLMHGDLDKLCGFFRDLNIRLTLLTTGLLLQRRAETVATCFDEVIVSLDGPQPVHDQIRRVPGAFKLIESGIAAVRRRAPKLRISCRTTVQKANHLALRSTVLAAKQLALDRISFLSADLSSQAFNRSQPWAVDRQDEIALTWSELHALEEEIEFLLVSCEADIGTGFVAENEHKLRGLANRFREHLDHSRPKAPLCNAPWVSAVIEVDGTVRPCFFHSPVGSLRRATLEEAINSDAALTFRSSLNVADNPVCRSCVCSLNYRG